MGNGGTSVPLSNIRCCKMNSNTKCWKAETTWKMPSIFLLGDLHSDKWYVTALLMHHCLRRELSVKPSNLYLHDKWTPSWFFVLQCYIEQWTHKWYPISCPHGWGMGCLLLVFWRTFYWACDYLSMLSVKGAPGIQSAAHITSNDS